MTIGYTWYRVKGAIMNEYVHLRIKEDTHRRMKVKAAELGITQDELTNLLLDEYERSKAQAPKRKPEYNPQDVAGLS